MDVSVQEQAVSPHLQTAKPIHTIVLDSSPLLLNSPSLSTLLANSTALFTTESVISEIKDLDARRRIETLYLPFITLRRPQPSSVAFVKQFAQKTGDATVLSKTDLEIVALAYDLECERNGGDWRLRRAPGQKRLNGCPLQQAQSTKEGQNHDEAEQQEHTEELETKPEELNVTSVESSSDTTLPTKGENVDKINLGPSEGGHLGAPSLEDGITPSETEISMLSEELSSDSDSAEWITPSNIKKHQVKEDKASQYTKSETKTLQVATITGDFAMQNVLLQMNLNLLSPATCKRIAHIKQTILRCHGCFGTTKDMTKQFCPRCGKPTLTRVSCTTNDRGEVKLHLKANMQWNNKGNVFSIPKPVAGSANQKWKGPRQGGGQEGWGSDLILAEDQKEYIRALSTNKRSVKKDLMDEDYLPDILTGSRNRGNGRVKVGAGRNINSKKK